ncbi:MAG TPA: sialidase family protein [Candidatus Eremiobacteraceae bacterium]|nr:sialidase family protein [Candidatus Eremiobacteraceae bacterium]
MFIVLGAFLTMVDACAPQHESTPRNTASHTTEPSVSGSIEVGRNVDVSASHATVNHAETEIGANPNDAKHLVACVIYMPETASEQQHEATGTTIAYASSDGGATWHEVVRPNPPGWDPDCRYDANGTAFFIGMRSFKDDAPHQNSLLVYRSQDGDHWSLTRVRNTVDRPFLGTSLSAHVPVYVAVLGESGSGRTPDEYYKSVKDFIQVVRSDDGGRTFSQVGTVPPTSIMPYHSHPIVLSDGTLVLMGTQDLPSTPGPPSSPVGDKSRDRFMTKPTNRLLDVISTDGGHTFSKPVKISDMYGGNSDMPAVDPGSRYFKDRIYVAWADARSGHQQIMLAYSKDAGKNWSSPRIVSDEREAMDLNDGPDQDGAEVAVNSAGVVGVSWSDRADIAPGEPGYYERFSASLDGGDTWLPSVRVAEKPYDDNGWSALSTFTTSPSSDGVASISVWDGSWSGHTQGITADGAGVFHPIWVENPTGVLQAMTAAVTVKGAVTRNGSGVADDLRLVINAIAFQFENATFDKSTHTLTLIARLKNTSHRVIEGPLVVKVLKISSRLGVPSIIGADNGLATSGATLDFGGSNDRLAPSTATPSRRITLKVDDLRPVKRDGYRVPSDMVDLSVTIYAK